MAEARKKEWFLDAEFWERFAPIMFDAAHWEEVSPCADGLVSLAAPDRYESPPAPVRCLEQCCGFGRIALEMARRGFEVTGVDITESYLAAAREDAAHEALDVELVHGDVRSFRRPGYFDFAYNVYISFGYCEESADDFRVVQNAFDSLKDGGVFVVETLGKEIAARDFVEAEWFERAGYYVLTRYECADSWAGLTNRWILMKDGRRFEKTFTQRLYAASELRALLYAAGFAAVEIYGGWDKSSYDQRAEKLIVAGRKGGIPCRPIQKSGAAYNRPLQELARQLEVVNAANEGHSGHETFKISE